MSDPNAPPREDDEFFVGYLASPPRTTRFAIAIAIGVSIVCGVVASAAAYLQRPPGDAAERNATIEGILLAEPYGMVRYLDGARVRHVLLVRGGKFGAPRDADHFDGRPVRVSGLLLERDGRQVIELHEAIRETEIDAAALARLRSIETEDLGVVEIAGEIVDSKCYLGRMRPGGGRTHRACAQLCILGNIPPVLVAHDARGRSAHYLLATRAHRSIAREVLPFVAEPVSLRGRLARTGDLLVLSIDAADIQRR